MGDFHKKLEDFEVLETLVPKAANSFSHPVYVVRKINTKADGSDKDHWILKRATNFEEAWCEVIAQELFRLFIPNHPKTRIVVGKENGQDVYYVLSKKMTHAISLEDLPKWKIKQKLLNGTFRGLGYIQVISLFLNETDLKLGNILVSFAEGNFAKIDGEYCFARLYKGKDKKYPITEHDISRLPYISDYPSLNWMDLKKCGYTNSSPETLDPAISNCRHYRNEVNEAILSIILMPDEVLRIFVENERYVCSQQDDILKELMDRKKQLEKAALSNDSFREYVQSDAAEHYITNFYQYLSDFKTEKKNHLLDEKIDVENMAKINISKIRNHIKYIRNAVTDNYKDNIRENMKHDFIPNEMQMSSFCAALFYKKEEDNCLSMHASSQFKSIVH